MIETNPLALKSGDSVRTSVRDPINPDLYRLVWMLKCVRVGCPGVMTKLLSTDEYGPCNICGATR